MKTENVGYNMKTPNLKMILETLMEDQPQPMSKEEKKQFVQEIANFSALGESVYGKGDIEEIVERVKVMIGCLMLHTKKAIKECMMIIVILNKQHEK